MKSFHQFLENVDELRQGLETIQRQDAPATRLAKRRTQELERRKRQIEQEKEEKKQRQKEKREANS